MAFSLTNQVALVTGGTGALGSALARGLAEAGARVAVMARNPDTVNALTAQLRADGHIAHPAPADVLDADALQAARAGVEAALGPVDVLVNAAGGNIAAATVQPDGTDFFALPPEALAQVHALNFTGTLLPCQVFGAGMAARGGGIILNIASMAALRPLSRVVGYGAAKAAVVNFTQWLAVTLAADGVRVNALAPGFFLGDQNRALLTHADGTLTARGTQILDHTPMRRFGQPDDLVGAAVWLCSDAARFVTGVVVPIDGGFSANSGV